MVNDPHVQQQPSRDSDVRRGRIMGGVVLVVLGVLFLLRNLYPWFRFEDYWPVILIAIGVVMMWKARGRS